MYELYCRAICNYGLTLTRCQLSVEKKVSSLPIAVEQMNFEQMHFEQMHFEQMHFEQMHFEQMHFEQIHFE
jgi:hypothetical protein